VIDDESDEDGMADSFLREAARIAPLPVEPDRSGTQLGRFRIDEKLGQGGMGVVYAAEDTELRRRVALKVLPHEAVANDERRRRLLREARTAASVSHPNLAAMYDVGEADGTVFLAMELVLGTTLRARIAAAPRGMKIADALSIALQIASGLGKAHASGVVHRDLKPENVMIDAADTVKIVDFGLAKLAASSTDAQGGGDLSTQDGRILGTPSYMAPEQAKASRVGPTADVFSLGVVLYEMLAGTRPFGGESPVDVLVAIARDAPQPPSKRAPAVTRDLDRIVLRCLAKEPAERFADGDAVAAALRAVMMRPRGSAVARRALLATGAAILVGIGGISMHSTCTSPAPGTLPTTAATPTAATASPDYADATTPAAPAIAVGSAVPSESAGPSAPAPTAKIVASARPARTTPRPAAAVASAQPSVDPLARQK